MLLLQVARASVCIKQLSMQAPEAQQARQFIQKWLQSSNVPQDMQRCLGTLIITLVEFRQVLKETG